MDGQSLDILFDKINKIKEILPEAFTENYIDWEKIKATLGENLNLSEEIYHLNWAGKSEVYLSVAAKNTLNLNPIQVG